MELIDHAVCLPLTPWFSISMTRADIRMSLFLVMFLAGWNDASQGPLLPSLQEYYNVNYTISMCPHRVLSND